MTRENRDIFAARLRHELTQETHVVVGDHQPEPKHAATHEFTADAETPDRCRLCGWSRSRHTVTRQMGKRRALAMGYNSGTMNVHEYKTGRFEPRGVAERQLDLYSFALTGGPRIPDMVIQDEHIFYGADEELAAIDGAAHHPLGDAERDRQYAKLVALPVNPAPNADPVKLDIAPCRCHHQLGNDFWFLPTGECLFNVADCPHRHVGKA